MCIVNMYDLALGRSLRPFTDWHPDFPVREKSYTLEARLETLEAEIARLKKLVSHSERLSYEK